MTLKHKSKNQIRKETRLRKFHKSHSNTQRSRLFDRDTKQKNLFDSKSYNGFEDDITIKKKGNYIREMIIDWDWDWYSLSSNPNIVW